MNDENKMAILGTAFRPFFWLGAIAAIGLIAYWILSLSGVGLISGQEINSQWHAHEMLFGYGMAIIAGFVLTAVQNWTGLTSAKGPALLLLVLVWLSGRLAGFGAGLLPAGLWMVLDLSFIPMVMYFFWRPLMMTKNYRNMLLLLILAGFLFCNLFYHLSAEVYIKQRALEIAVYLILLLMAILGGRVIPMFTRNGLMDPEVVVRPLIERASLLSLLLLIVAHVVYPEPTLTSLLALAAGLINLYRLIGWGGHKTLKTPIIWVLHLGYLWICMGLITKGFDAFTSTSLRSFYLHMFTVGAMGTLIIGMITRVALGHTGRSFTLPAGIPYAYGFVSIGAVVRCFLPMFIPSSYFLAIYLSASLWILAFLLFLFSYTPILWHARVDGKPG